MNIYVANLGNEATDSDLRDLFTSFGEVTSAKVIKDRDTGYSRGFGFVEMSNKNEATKAIEALNNADYQGQYLSVKEARPKSDSQNSYGNQSGGGYGNQKSGGFSKKW